MATTHGGLVRERSYVVKGGKARSRHFEAMVRLKGHPLHSKSFASAAEGHSWLRVTLGEIETGACSICRAKAPPPEPEGGPVLRTLFKSYLENPRFLALRPRSQSTAKECLRWLEKHGWENLTPADLTPAFILEFQEARQRDGVGASRINGLLGYAAAALKYSKRRGLIPVNPLADGFEQFPENKRERIPEASEVDAMDKALPAWCRPVVKFLTAVPARISETLALTWADLDVDKGTLMFRPDTTKSGRPRTIPLCLFPQTWAMLREMKASFPTMPIFPGPTGEPVKLDYVERTWARARKAASVDGLKMHDLKHGAVSGLARRGVPDSLISYCADHALPVASGITARYQHLNAEHFLAEAQRYLAKQA